MLRIRYTWGDFLTNKQEGKHVKEEGTMAATARNYAYEVRAKDAKKILAQQPASKAFLDECKRAAQKYRKRK